MGKAEIQSWISASSSEPEAVKMFAWNKDHVLEDWQMAIMYAQDTLLTSRTKRRIQFLREELLPIASIAGEFDS